MVLTNDDNDILDDYYGIDPAVAPAARVHPDPVLPCDNSTNHNRYGIGL